MGKTEAFPDLVSMTEVERVIFRNNSDCFHPFLLKKYLRFYRKVYRIILLWHSQVFFNYLNKKGTLKMKILVINAGSSSLKYQLIDMETEQVLAKGLCERIGIGGHLKHSPLVGGKPVFNEDLPLPTHSEAIAAVIDKLTSAEYGVVSSMRRCRTPCRPWRRKICQLCEDRRQRHGCH